MIKGADCLSAQFEILICFHVVVEMQIKHFSDQCTASETKIK